MRAFVYWNLHKRVFSIRVNGRVIAHARRVLIQNPEFTVSEKGRARVLASGRKNVHAGVVGDVLACDSELCDRRSPLLTWLDVASEATADLADWQPVRYDPYEAGEFRTMGDGRAIKVAGLAYGYANRLTGKPNLYAKG